MQGPALVVREVVTIVVGNQIDNRPLGQACRLIEDEAPLSDTRSETTHRSTVRVSNLPGNPKTPQPLKCTVWGGDAASVLAPLLRHEAGCS